MALRLSHPLGVDRGIEKDVVQQSAFVYLARGVGRSIHAFQPLAGRVENLLATWGMNHTTEVYGKSIPPTLESGRKSQTSSYEKTQD